VGVDVEKARKHLLSAYEGSFVKDTQVMGYIALIILA
jgi:hypothetical protein